MAAANQVIQASNGLGLALLTNAMARRFAVPPEHDRNIILPQNGLGDQVRVAEFGGPPVACYVLGRDRRSLPKANTLERLQRNSTGVLARNVWPVVSPKPRREPRPATAAKPKGGAAVAPRRVEG